MIAAGLVLSAMFATAQASGAAAVEAQSWDGLAPRPEVFVRATARKYLAGDPSEYGFLGTMPASLGFDRAAVQLSNRAPSPVGYSVRLDVPRGGSPVLYEGAVTADLGVLALSVGHLRAPLSAEWLADDRDLPAITRPRYLESAADPTTRQSFGQVAAPALQASLGLPFLGVRAWASADDVATRLDVHPGPSLDLGLFYLAPDPFAPKAPSGEGTSGTASPPPPTGATLPGPPIPRPRILPSSPVAARGFHDRWGGDVGLRLGRLRLGGEYVSGYEANAFGGSFARGAQVHGLVDIPAGHQVLVRYDSFAPEFRFAPDSATAQAIAAAARAETVTLGWSYQVPATGCRLQFEYARQIFAGPDSADSLAAALSMKL